MMHGWTAEAIVAVLTALTALVGALAVAAVKVIEALRDLKKEVLHSRDLSDERAETIKATIAGTGDGGKLP